MSKQKVKNVLNLINLFSGKPDGTYDISTGKEVTYTCGYQVSFVRPEAFQQLNSEEWDEITNCFSTYFDSAPNIGVYCNNAEVSFCCISRDKSEKAMEELNQESILDWKSKEENPDSIEKWFILNSKYDEKKVLNYGEIFKKVC